MKFILWPLMALAGLLLAAYTITVVVLLCSGQGWDSFVEPLWFVAWIIACVFGKQRM